MYTKLQSMVDRLNNVVQEGLTAIRAVKASCGMSTRKTNSTRSTPT